MRMRLILLLVLLGAAPVVSKDPPPPRPFPELQAEFRAATGPARQAALTALSQHKTAECVRFLDEVRRTDTDVNLRGLAIHLIGVVGVDPARTVLEEVLARGDRTQRTKALDALAAIRPPVPPDRFIAALAQREDGALRRSAARVLAAHPREDVARQLANTLVECTPPPPAREAAPSVAPVDVALRSAALESLRALVSKPPVDAWLVSEGLSLQTAFAPALIDLLRVATACPHEGLGAAARAHAKSPLAPVRGAVADLLGELDAGERLGGLDSLDVLAKLLRDPDTDVVICAALAVSRIGPVGDALGEVLALARSRNPTLKTLGIGALASCRDEPKAVRVAADGLDDEALPVRAAAVGTLRALGTKEAVTALVAGLKKNDDGGRLNGELLAALMHLTGARPGDDHAAWNTWWSRVKDDFVLPTPGEGAPARAVTRERVPKYYGNEVVSRRVAFVIDVSGSMSARVRDPETKKPGKTRLELCQRELQTVIEGLRDGSAFNLIPFDSSPKPWRERAVVLGRVEREAALGAVRVLQPGGGTNIFDPLELALLDAAIDTIYLLSDGSPGSGKYVRDEDILREVRKLNAVRRVAIHTLSVASENALMRALAAENAGSFMVVK